MPSVRALFLTALLSLQMALPGNGQAPAPPAAPALTLDEVMSSALAANPALAAARLGRAEAQARGEVARQRPNPELSIEESKDYPRDAAVLSVPIERGGKRSRRIALAEAQARSNQAELARLEAQTRNAVRRAYFALAAAQQRVTETAELPAVRRERPRRRPRAVRGGRRPTSRRAPGRASPRRRRRARRTRPAASWRAPAPISTPCSAGRSTARWR